MGAIWKDIGPCEVSFDGTVLGKSVANDEGGTHGGCRFRINQEARSSFRDKTGTMPYDQIVVGTTVEVMANLTGMSVEQFAEILPGATLSTGPTKKRIDIKSAVGRSMRDNAKELILKPIVDGVATTDEQQWITLSKAHPLPDIDLAFDMENQRVWAVTFAAFDDLTTEVIAKIGTNTT